MFIPSSSFAVSYAEEAAEKQYIVRLKTSDVQLMNADGSRHFFDIADESTLDELLREDLVEWSRRRILYGGHRLGGVK